MLVSILGVIKGCSDWIVPVGSLKRLRLQLIGLLDASRDKSTLIDPRSQFVIGLLTA